MAIIMDGNGRWAQLRGQPRADGHRAGVEALRRIVRVAPELGISFLTVYAFSTENWKRPQAEVETLMGLLVEYLRSQIEELDAEGVRMRFIGDESGLPQVCRREMERAQRRTAGNARLTLTIALNYGGRDEIVRAVRRLLASAPQPSQVDEQTISQQLDTGGMPDPDLIIRVSGEERLSNFLLWQSAYAEIHVSDVLWPDFDRADLEAAIADFRHRERRYGGLK